MTDSPVTEALMDSVLDRLRQVYREQLEVDYFPDDPRGYRLNHVNGALLLGFSRAQFGADRASDAVWIERELTLPLTLIFRQLRGPQGVIGYLDRVRQTLTGWMPTHADRPLRPVAEQFVGNSPGLWQYAQDWSTRTVQVQACDHRCAPAAASPHFDEDFT